MDEKKYLNSDGLIRLVANLINNFAQKTHNHTVSEISDYQALDEITEEEVIEMFVE